MGVIDRAVYIKKQLTSKKIAKNSVRGIMANMYEESASSFNPHISQIGGGPGRGLCQWTIGSNLSSATWGRWLSMSKKNAIKAEVNYIVDHPGQWIYNGATSYPMTFNQFLKNSKNLSPRKLTIAFMQQWERPADSSWAHGSSRWDKYAGLEKRHPSLRKKSSGGGGGSSSDSGSGGSSSGGGGHKKEENTTSDTINKVIQELKAGLTFDIHNITRTNYYENSVVVLERTYNNTFKVRLKTSIINDIENSLNNDAKNDPGKQKDDVPDKGKPIKGGAKGWLYPIKGKGNPTSGFGNRTIYGHTQFHDGLDFGSSQMFSGNGVYCAHSGRVTFAGYVDNTFKCMIRTISPDGYVCHYQEFSVYTRDILVKNGQQVRKGQKIARVSPYLDIGIRHLHFGITRQKNFAKAIQHAYTNDGTFLNPWKFVGNKKWG